MKPMRKEVVYKHPVADVWTAITDRRALAEWLMPNDFEPRLGHKFRFQTDPNKFCGEVMNVCEVLEFEPPHRMVWSWTEAPIGGAPAPGAPSLRVEWGLMPQGASTRLTLTQTGMEYMPWWKRVLMGFGWSGMLKDKLSVVVGNVRGGEFTPGAVPLNKRYYKATKVPADLSF